MNEENQEFLTGKLLLAMPSIGDPRFDHAVVYVCAHDENGAMGLVVNQDAPGIRFDKVLEQLGVSSEIAVDFKKLPQTVFHGGPVDPGRGFLLHTHEFNQKDTVEVDQHYGITGTIDALQDIACGKGPDNFLFILGYAGWTAGQLEDEIRQNAWLVTEAKDDIIFDTEMNEKWNKAVSTLGFDPAMLTGDAGRA